LGAIQPDAAPLCFESVAKVVCPTDEVRFAAGASRDIDAATAAAAGPLDIALVELLGAIAAMVATAASLRGYRAVPSPYSIPVALALLKIATGALTAVLGLMLLRGAFIPGLGGIDTQAQVLAWAIVFGYAQQLFTRYIDAQAQSIVSEVGGRSGVADPARAEDVVSWLNRVLPNQLGREVEDRIAGPRLVNYSGWVMARVLDAEGATVEPTEDRGLPLRPGHDYSLEVTIDSDAGPGISMPLLITGGVDEESATFTISLESDDRRLRHPAKPLTVATSDGAAQATFSLRIDPELSEPWLWIRVAQAGEVVLQLELNVADETVG
jgi:hypothetical protein